MFSYHDEYKNLMDKAIKEIKEKVENEGSESTYCYDKAILIDGIAPNSSKGRIVELLTYSFIDSDGHVISFFDIDNEEFFIFCDRLLNTRKY
tara:strand:- start:688 stop:963 length:276 start_codon:yes stop_codon:yes gene_type:complete